jgi:ABC-type branched-subunit amino acid transport system ATPase component
MAARAGIQQFPKDSGSPHARERHGSVKPLRVIDFGIGSDPATNPRWQALMLEIRDLNQFYGESHTLWDVSLSISAGACMCLMGRNGVGKTTLLKTVMGLIAARSGSVTFDGKSLLLASADARARLGIAYVPQGREIFPLLSVEENLRIGLPARRDGK